MIDISYYLTYFRAACLREQVGQEAARGQDPGRHQPQRDQQRQAYAPPATRTAQVSGKGKGKGTEEERKRNGQEK